MMTIDEAIIHAEKKGQELGCTECAQEHFEQDMSAMAEDTK